MGQLWLNHGELWGILRKLWLIHGELWGIMVNYGEIWGIMGNYGVLWGVMSGLLLLLVSFLFLLCSFPQTH